VKVRLSMHASRPVQILVRKLKAGLTLRIDRTYVGVHFVCIHIVFLLCFLPMACCIVTMNCY
jgi:hypothetical protein